MGSFVDGFSWSVALTLLLGGYALAVAVFLVLENRSPQSTFAWVFLLLIFPGGGLVIYVMFGRGRHAFSRKETLATIYESGPLAERAAKVIANQPAMLRALADSKGDYARLAAMLWETAKSPLTLHNRIEILQNASAKYPRLVGDIRTASSSIHLLYYEWASDAFTERVAEDLVAKAAQGVDVRILYDPVGSASMLRRSYVKALRRNGVRMHPFSKPYLLHMLSYRSHRKIAVIDGRIGYSGGLNMTEKHLTGPKGFAGWRDTHARVSGEAVPMLQTVFATMWLNTVGENLFDERHFPKSEADAEPRLPLQVVSAGPDSRWESIRQSYLTMIALARRHIYLQTPFLILDTSVAEALKTTALAGIDVRLMIAPAGAELSPAYRAGLTFAADMARAGVKVFLYRGAYFHAKTVCVDSTVCTIGSANMDIRSFSINYETNLVIYDAAVTCELETAFADDLTHCVSFTEEDYRRRPLGARIVDSTARLCSPLL